MADLLDRYTDRIKGVVGCYDRVVIHGTLPGICYAAGMTSLLNSRDIRVFDYTKWAEPLRQAIRTNAETVAAAQGVQIEFVRKLRKFRKEQRIKAVLQQRGHHPGLVHILSAMAQCPSYTPWHDKKTGQTFLKPSPGKCLHYYFYFIDPEFGLCYLRVPTGRHFACSSTSTATTGLPIASRIKALASPCSTMRSPLSTTSSGRRRSQTTSTSRDCTNASTISPDATVPYSTQCRPDTTGV